MLVVDDGYVADHRLCLANLFRFAWASGRAVDLYFGKPPSDDSRVGTVLVSRPAGSHEPIPHTRRRDLTNRSAYWFNLK